jgi:hypothetical protein
MDNFKQLDLIVFPLQVFLFDLPFHLKNVISNIFKATQKEDQAKADQNLE